ncbi:MAG: hypothetical protein ACPGED_01095 [Flavobacteriales bacterium]
MPRIFWSTLLLQEIGQHPRKKVLTYFSDKSVDQLKSGNKMMKKKCNIKGMPTEGHASDSATPDEGGVP